METLDFERLRNDLINYLEGAYFVGGFGMALMEVEDIKKANNEELIKIAIDKGLNIEDYQENIYK